MKVAILIPTRNREKQLGTLLSLICEQIASSPEHEFSVFVINTSVSDCVIGSMDSKIPLFYYHEPSSGYVIPRNELLSKLDSSFDVGIFIDDDEYPGPNWLEGLLASISINGVVAATGPVLPDFQDYVGWMSSIPLYYHNDGSQSKSCNILGGNVALNLRALFPVLGNTLFDMHFNKFGGEDTWLAHQIVENFGSAAISLNSSAIAYEIVTSDRLEYEWLINRSKNTGRALATIRRHSNDRGRVQHTVAVPLKALAQILLISFLPRKRTWRVKALLIRLEIIKAQSNLQEFFQRH
jgi:succinoglycan biosynthesis protein ExoM